MIDVVWERLRHLWHALGYTLKGLRAVAREQAFQIELAALVVAIPVGVVLGDTGAERALLVGVWLLLPVVEMLNTAVEALVDRFGAEHDELGGRAKDLGSAAVGTTALLAVVVWLLVLVG